MKYRKLRIAWSVGCGILCLLLIMLWVRSYLWHHTFSFNYRTTAVDILSMDGELNWFSVEHPTPLSFGWNLSVHSPDDEVHRYMTFIRPQLQKYTQAGISYWHATMVCAIAAVASSVTAPWRNFKQFSLRTLLTGMTVVAVALGLIFALSR
jgi:hypothetical protein